jgi:uncharacterized membrane protein YbhN (UPF0104 family)
MMSKLTNNAPNPSHWKRYSPLIRIVFSCLLLLYAFSNIDWHTVQLALPLIQPIWLLLALVLMLFCTILSGLRWALIMRRSNTNSFQDCVLWYFAGGLINQGLPSTLGGDSYRALKAHQASKKQATHDANLSVSFINVALDRSLGLAGSCLLGALGLAIGGAMLGEWVPSLGWTLLLIMLIGAGLISLLLYIPQTRSLYQQLLQKIQAKQSFKPTIFAWGAPYNLIQIPVATGIHYLNVLAFLACLEACQVRVPIEALLIAIPAMALLMILPLSISGWGIRETSVAAILGLWGIEASLVILASIFYGLLTIVNYLPGAYQLMLRKNEHLS